MHLNYWEDKEGEIFQKMFYLKGCPKCLGDVYKSTDIYGPYTSCMQCSRYLTEAEEMQLNHFSLSLAMQLSTAAQQVKIEVDPIVRTAIRPK